MRRKVGVIALLALLGAGIVVFHEPLRLSWLVLRGRSPHCSFSQAIRATAHAHQLTRTKDRILAASWLVEKDPAGFQLWETPRGLYWIPQGDQYILPFNLAEQEAGIYSRGAITVRPGDIVLDCGANVGVFTRVALKAGAFRVVAIEPAPDNIECLRRNFAGDIASGRVILYPKGVWDRDGVLTLHEDPNNTAADSFVINRQGWQDVKGIPVTTIDALVTELHLPRVDFIKMDIEGAEPRALKGARKTLKRFRPRLAISSYHAPDHPVLIPAAVRAARPDYKMVCGPCSETKQGIRPDVLLFR